MLDVLETRMGLFEDILRRIDQKLDGDKETVG